MESSTIYSMGTALNRAQANGIRVEILVDGTWLLGRVVSVDAHGVLMDTDMDQHVIVRLDAISVVRVHSAAPGNPTVPQQQARFAQ